jgi:N-acyl-D-amino-acid deacylase
VRVHEVKSAELKQFEGQTIADIAKAQGKDGVDAFLDLTLLDDLDLEFTLSTFNHRVDRMKEILANPDFLLGLGDGGAHVDMLCDSGYPTYLLGTWVREHQALTLEQGVRRLTADPADFYGIKDRGRLKVGLAGDITIFDPSTVGSSNRGERRYDLPGGGKRMVMPSRGVHYTIVNGEPIFVNGSLTEARAGRVLRS